MSKVEEIMSAIEKLTLEERAELNQRLYGSDDEEWDEQMANDFASGKNDEWLKRIDKDIDEGNLREFPT